MNRGKLSFSPFIIGTMRLGVWGQKMNTTQWQSFIDNCLKMGINDFDHADIYGDYTTEQDFGKAIQDNSSIRQSIQITTKCGIRMPASNRPNNRIKSYDSSPNYIIDSVENSLRNFHTDYLDLLLLHRPDFLMDPESIALCFESLKKSGKVLHFGVSNFSTSQYNLLNKYFPLENHQIEASIFNLNPFENGLIDQLLLNKVTPTAWSPLGGGKKAFNEANGALKTTIKGLCEKYSINQGQLLLAWLLRHPSGITPILGTTKISRVQEALAIKDLQIEREDWYSLYSASKGQIVP